MVMVPILINKDMFEPNYNLKFTVQNHNYFLINLINVFSKFVYCQNSLKKNLQNRMTKESQILI